MKRAISLRESFRPLRGIREDENKKNPSQELASIRHGRLSGGRSSSSSTRKRTERRKVLKEVKESGAEKNEN